MAKEGVEIEFLSQEKLNGGDFEEKVDLILERVKEGKILVLEAALSPDEKSRLIEIAMENVDEDFPGIEFSALEGKGAFYDKILDDVFELLGQERNRGLTVVGNSNVMEKLEEEKDAISFRAVPA